MLKKIALALLKFLIKFVIVLLVYAALEWNPNNQPAVPANDPVIGVFNGYNFFLKDSTTATGYIQKGMFYLSQARNLRAIIVTGGVTRPSERPGESEARIMRDALLSQGVVVPIIMEERAQSTWQNEKFVAEILDHAWLKEGTKIMLFSDIYHRPKVIPMSFWLLGRHSVLHFGIDLRSEHDQITRWTAERRPVR